MEYECRHCGQMVKFATTWVDACDPTDRESWQGCPGNYYHPHEIRNQHDDECITRCRVVECEKCRVGHYCQACRIDQVSDNIAAYLAGQLIDEARRTDEYDLTWTPDPEVAARAADAALRKLITHPDVVDFISQQTQIN